MRDRKTSVSGAHYVVHIERPGYPKHVWCGRFTADVNSVRLKEGDEVNREEHCQTCVRCATLGVNFRSIEAMRR